MRKHQCHSTRRNSLRGGGTDLPNALAEFFGRGHYDGVDETVVITDSEGARQFTGWPEKAVRPHRITVMTYAQSGVPEPWAEVQLHGESVS